jgi:DNA repair protein SbcC/Rad50
MKFKRIEISAFRIYNTPSDSVFDFTLNGETPADFVSLYAPNGFGKTSLYDAIEWGVTNDVFRFWQREEHTTESITALRSLDDGKQVKLIRNRNAERKTKTYVKITTDQETGFERELSVHGNNVSDIKKIADPENVSFRRVILSQEWISAFLKENNGEKRYEKFMENPELEGIDNYYRTVKAVISAGENSVGDLSAQISRLEVNVNEIGDKEFLNTINTAIGTLREQGETLENITLETTDKQVLNFSDKITIRLSDIQIKKDNLVILLEATTIARSGSDKLTGVATYFKNRQSVIDLLETLGKLEALLLRLNELDKTNNELSSLAERKKENLSHLDTISQLLSKYPEYERVQGLIKNLNSELQKISIKLVSLEKLKSEKNNEKNDLQAKLEGCIQQLNNTVQILENLPGLKNKIEGANKNIKILNDDAKQLEKDKQRNNEQIIKVKTEIDSLNLFLNALESRNYAVQIPTGLTLTNSELLELVEVSEKIKGFEEELSSLSIKLNEQESINEALKYFVSKGLEIVNSTKASDCPLCTTFFDSYEQLAAKISNNKLFNEAIQVLLKQKTTVENNLTEIEKRLENKRSTIIKTISESKSTAIALHTSLIESNKQIDILGESKKSQEKNLQTELTAQLAQLDGMTFQEYEIRIKELTERLRQEQSQYKQTNDVLSVDLLKLEEEINRLKLNQGTKENEALSFSQNKDYAMLADWFKINSPETFNRSILEKKKRQINISIIAINTLYAGTSSLISKEREELSRYTVTGLSAEIAAAKNSKEELLVQISMYEAYLKEKLKVESGSLLIEALTALLDEHEATAKKEVVKCDKLKGDYTKLQGYGANLLPFLKSEAAKIQIKNLKEQQDFLRDVVLDKLIKERDSISQFLEYRIKSFFYEDIINNIYNKIDPHPDFKGVKFIANFDLDNPRLDVLVTNNSDEQKLIPNLYFSTAQINILSLSIFLASALNTTDYDCIFIDDPIQSMDSINVLSAIDLIRGIVQTGQKQIILSTHDENFHNLLKKKMPTNLFKSKYLELETFGKVKQS